MHIHTSHVNCLNKPIKRQRLIGVDLENDPTVGCLQEAFLKHNDIGRLKIKGEKSFIMQAFIESMRAYISIR